MNERRAPSLRSVRGKVLEIGIGTGLNLPHYPEKIRHLVGIDANAGMLKKLQKKLPQARMEVQLHCTGAEKLPFADASFDTVVSTHVLCSLPDRARALAEIRRVLQPEGQFVFLEHGLSPEASVAKWQRRINCIQKRFAVGCLLDVPMKEEISAAGFSFETLSVGYLAKESKTHGYLYEGVAVKA